MLHQVLRVEVDRLVVTRKAYPPSAFAAWGFVFSAVHTLSVVTGLAHHPKLPEGRKDEENAAEKVGE